MCAYSPYSSRPSSAPHTGASRDAQVHQTQARFQGQATRQSAAQRRQTIAYENQQAYQPQTRAVQRPPGGATPPPGARPPPPPPRCARRPRAPRRCQRAGPKRQAAARCPCGSKPTAPCPYGGRSTFAQPWRRAAESSESHSARRCRTRQNERRTGFRCRSATAPRFCPRAQTSAGAGHRQHLAPWIGQPIRRSIRALPLRHAPQPAT